AGGESATTRVSGIGYPKETRAQELVDPHLLCPCGSAPRDLPRRSRLQGHLGICRIGALLAKSTRQGGRGRSEPPPIARIPPRVFLRREDPGQVLAVLAATRAL